MNYAEIKYCDIANGVGVRTSLFVAGCRHGCPGCFNQIAWDFAMGKPYDSSVEDEIVASLEPDYVAGITLLGGEPLEPENQPALADLLMRIKRELPNKSVWIYSGFTWEELTELESRAQTAHLERMLNCCDVLVDGRFEQALYDISLRFRGSSNQRIIDVPASRAAGEIVLWQGDEILAKRSSWQ
ncbi:MAG: anaerobic ribonucleoside-triphosphate reductase activating protein [Atopobiaceae bacterium]|nr:anaerobic ribonucleoside-triphosphate reductase activating protein [Atopobiaceae bacterium]